MTRILIVDDEKEITDLLALYAERAGFESLKAYSCKEAFEIFTKKSIDIAILDVLLPDGNGFELCKTIRQTYTFPIIMLTAKEEENDIIQGLSCGADDYMTKPFYPLELIARLNAHLRRVTTYNTATLVNNDTLEVMNLSLNKKTKKCFLNAEVLALTKSEFSILQTLLEHAGSVISAEELCKTISGDQYYESAANSVMVHIRHLREKMHDTGRKPKYIKTVWGIGYTIG